MKHLALSIDDAYGISADIISIKYRNDKSCRWSRERRFAQFDSIDEFLADLHSGDWALYRF
ncbi:hypothetical protein [Bartonella australis]|uniref:hypothetical protein n=1 Tax=Bartonella australis TaxID=388640 RepID=UPI001181A0D0|nr:hypothetical protein [Bartonella australis]